MSLAVSSGQKQPRNRTETRTGRVYLAIDLKSFYASVECVERGLDPLTTNLVVADVSRSEKTICLAVTPALKSFGVPGRPRLFQVAQKVREVNRERKQRSPQGRLETASVNLVTLQQHPEVALDYLVAPPQMAHYMEISARIYQIYLRWVAPEDIHVYSIDEVFMDVTRYLEYHGCGARELCARILHQVFAETGITATAGIATNLFLAKVAMDVVAKRAEPDEHGVRMAWLDEASFRRELWCHRPLHDFWRLGPATERKLAELGLLTLGDVARCSLGERYDRLNQELLYKNFGVNAELLIDHAWGVEPCTIADIKAYRPTSSSLGQGQVLPRPYSYKEGLLIVREMADLISLDLVDRGLVCSQVVLDVHYDNSNLEREELVRQYAPQLVVDRWGKRAFKPVHGSLNLVSGATSSTREIVEAFTAVYERVVQPEFTVRRLSLSTAQVISEVELAIAQEKAASRGAQLDLFTDYEAQATAIELREQARVRERSEQEAVLDIKRKFGKNAVFKAAHLEEASTARARNRMTGGHRD